MSYRWEDDGSLSFRGRLTAEEGALFLKALEAGRDACRPGLGREDHRARSRAAEEAQAADRTPVTNADALVAMAESSFESRAGASSAADRYQAVVTAEVGALGATDGEKARCRLDSGSPLAPETLRRIACDVALRRGPPHPALV